MKILFCFLLISFSSCSLFRGDSDQWGEELIEDFQVNNNDYVLHYKNLADDFIKNGDVRVSKIGQPIKRYLDGVIDKIKRNNQNFFENINIDFKYYYIREKKPIHFSLPSGEIFLSSGLVEKYIEHESNLVCVLAYELIRVSKGVYPKNFTIPKGYIALPYFLSLLRVDTDEKIKIHKWAYYSIKRSGFDENGYLTWIQTQNRNYLDFALHLGDHSSIFKEEAELKDFIVEKYGHNFDLAVEFNSSSNFYRFLSVLK